MIYVSTAISQIAFASLFCFVAGFILGKNVFADTPTVRHPSPSEVEKNALKWAALKKDVDDLKRNVFEVVESARRIKAEAEFVINNYGVDDANDRD